VNILIHILSTCSPVEFRTKSEIMAGLIKRGNSWVAVWKLDGKQTKRTTGIHVLPMPQDGQVTARQLKKLAQATADAMEAAEKREVSQEKAVAAVRAAFSTLGKREVLTLRKWGAKWIETQKKKKSFNACRKIITTFTADLPDIPLESVTLAHVQDWSDKCLERVSANTVDRYLIEVSAMFNRAVAERIIPTNPARGVRMPTWALNESMQRDIFTTSQLKVIFEKFPGEWPDLAAVCLLLGGLRLSEVALLKWQAVDFEQKLVKVRSGKTNKGMTKPMIPALRKILEKRQNSGLMAFDEHVFPFAAARIRQAGGKSSKLSVEFGKLLEEHGLRKSSKQRRKEGEESRTGRLLSSLSFHSLRSTAVTFLLQGGVASEMVQLLVGHDDLSIEGKHYFKPTMEMQAEVMEALKTRLGM
jgi:integrase